MRDTPDAHRPALKGRRSPPAHDCKSATSMHPPAAQQALLFVCLSVHRVHLRVMSMW